MCKSCHFFLLATSKAAKGSEEAAGHERAQQNLPLKAVQISKEQEMHLNAFNCLTRKT